MSFRWVYTKPEKQGSVHKLQDALGVSSLIAHLLAIRGIDTFDAAKTFFRPEVGNLHDPFLMKDMEKGAARLFRAIRDGEKVLVYGDYDVDGITATASVHLFLKEFGVDVGYYIPHRFKEGYGINSEGVRYASEIGADLIVAVDCGITAVEEAGQISNCGIDLIICDHHTVGNDLPLAAAVLDPKRPDCSYPFDGLSGAGVGFKLIQATISRLGLPAEMAYQFLDLTAISIASDIVPVTGENRVMMRKGLEMINSKPRPGIQALLNLISANSGTITSSTIVFSLGPRINAAGRMGDATVAVELMICDNVTAAAKQAGELEAINTQRRVIDSKTMKEAESLLENDYNMEEISSMVLHDSGWHLGVVGIVASRLVDAYYRPAIMLSTVDGKIKGSARSVKGFNIYEALKECDDLLEQFGGHEYAAGLTMERGNLDEFRRRITELAGLQLSEKDFTPELNIDTRLDLGSVDARFWKLLSQFEPFGPGNSKPVFVSEGVEISGVPAIVGNGHLKLQLRQNGSAVFDAIGFNMHQYLPLVREPANGRIDVAYVIEENFWNNKRTLQLRLKDIQPGN